MSKEQLEGKSLYDFFPRDQADAYWKDDKDVMDSGKPKTNIIEPMTSNEGTLWVQTDKIPYRDTHGNIIGIVGFAIDITERKNAEDELRIVYAKERQISQEREQLVHQLQDALARIRKLEPFLPICASCKKIRDDKGQWHHMESYISTRTDTKFTHGYCQECYEKLVKDLPPEGFK